MQLQLAVMDKQLHITGNQNKSIKMQKKKQKNLFRR